MVVNEEILSGLKAALERGQSLKSSMNSFLNSGYSKEEIEEAARALAEPFHEKKITETIPAPAIQKIEKPKKQFFKKLFEKKIYAPVKPKPAEIKKEKIPELEKEKPIQKQIASSYGEEKKERLWIIILLSFMILLIGALILVFIFNKDIINFFQDLFNQ